MFQDSLNRIIRQCDGAVAGVVMGFDGIAVETVSHDAAVDVSKVGMEFSFVLGQVRKAADLLDAGTLEEVSIRSSRMTFLIRVLNEEYFLGVAMQPGANFGKGRFLMRQAVPELLAQF